MRNKLLSWYHSLTWEKVLLFLAQWLSAGTLLVLFSFSYDFLSSFSFLRNIIFRILTVIICFLYLLLFSLNRSYKPRFNSSLFVLILLFLTYCLSAVVNGTLMTSFWGDYLRMDGLFALVHYIVFAFVVSALFRDFSAWSKVWQLLLFVSFCTALIAVSQFLHYPLLIDSAGGIRVSSTFGNVSYYGFFQSLAFFLSLYVVANPRLKQVPLILWFFLFADILLIFLEIYTRVHYHQPGLLRQLVGNLYLVLIWLWPQFWLLRFRLVHQPWQRWLAVVSLLLLQLLAIWLSGARSAIIATATGLICLALILAVRLSQRWHKNQRLILIGLSTLVVLITTWLSRSFLFRIPQYLQEYNSFTDRLIVWQISWKAFLAKPILGWGPENFLTAFNRYYDDRLFRSGISPIWYDKAHNILIQHLVDGGLLAALLYLILWLLIIRSFRHLWRQRPAERTSWVVLAVFALVYWIQSLFYFDTISNQLLFFILLSYLWSREAELSNAVKRYGLPLRVPFGRPIFFSLISAITVLFIYNFYLDSILANKDFTTKLMTVRTDWSQATEDKLESIRLEAAKSPTLGKSELRYQYVLLISDFITQGSPLPAELLKSQVAIAESVLLKNISKKPTETETYVQLANYYLLAGRVDKVYWERGLKVAQMLRRDNPNRTQLLYLEGQMFLALGLSEDGLALFRQAAERRPEVVDTHMQYYKQLTNLQRLPEAERYFQLHLSSVPSEDILAVIKYDIGARHFDLALKHLEVLKNRQELSEDVATLSAVALLLEGKQSEALKQAQEAVMLYPSLLPTLQQYFPSLESLSN